MQESHPAELEQNKDIKQKIEQPFVANAESAQP